MRATVEAAAAASRFRGRRSRRRRGPAQRLAAAGRAGEGRARRSIRPAPAAVVTPLLPHPVVRRGAGLGSSEVLRTAAAAAVRCRHVNAPHARAPVRPTGSDAIPTPYAALAAAAERTAVQSTTSQPVIAFRRTSRSFPEPTARTPPPPFSVPVRSLATWSRLRRRFARSPAAHSRSPRKLRISFRIAPQKK